jgi:hypothetical protein
MDQAIQIAAGGRRKPAVVSLALQFIGAIGILVPLTAQIAAPESRDRGPFERRPMPAGAPPAATAQRNSSGKSQYSDKLAIDSLQVPGPEAARFGGPSNHSCGTRALCRYLSEAPKSCQMEVWT